MLRLKSSPIVILIQSDSIMIEIIKDPILENISVISHGFFTRKGGVSQGVYASLNCCYSSDDIPENVSENRSRVMSHFNMGVDKLVTVKNTHSDKVIIVDIPWQETNKPEADGMVTKNKNIMLGTDTADCPAILFADERAYVIGLCHAGWKGAKLGVIDNTIEKMLDLGAKIENIKASIGPCIAQMSYEVGKEFYQDFVETNQDNKVFFKAATKPDYFYFDLRNYVKNRLLQLGITKVSDVEIDTYTEEKYFFSYRRSVHKNEPDFGGHFSCLYLV